MKPRTLGQMYQGLADVVDEENMITGEEEEERDERETECEGEHPMCSSPKNVEVINEAVDEFVLEHQTNDVGKAECDAPIKLEMSDDERAAGIYSDTQVSTRELETAQSEKSTKLNEKSDFLAETDGSKDEPGSTEIDELAVLERCVLPSSPSRAPTKDSELNNETDGEDIIMIESQDAKETSKRYNQSLVASGEQNKEAKEGETSEPRKKRNVKPIERFQFDCRLITAKELAAQLKYRQAKYKESYRRSLANETPEHREKRLQAAAERRRKTIESETPEQRQARLARYKGKKRKKNETPEQREKRSEKARERYRRLKAIETPEQREKRLAAAAERYRKSKKPPVTPEQRKKRLARRAERYRRAKESETPEQREKRMAVSAEKQRRATENETMDQRRKRLAAITERRRKAKESETPEQREKRIEGAIKSFRRRIAKETPEQRKKRLAVSAEYRKRTKERETMEQRFDRTLKKAEYHRMRWAENRGASPPLDERRLPFTRSCKSKKGIKVEQIDLTEDGLSSEDDSEDSIESDPSDEEDFSSRDSEDAINEEDISDQYDEEQNTIRIKSEAHAVDENEEVDFSAQRVSETFIKSETAPVEDEEIEIDFEAHLETEIKMEPRLG